MSAPPNPVAPGSARAWLMAARPVTLTAALTPVLVGSASAFHAARVRAGPALAALAGAFLLQIGTNLANDLFDYEKGADASDRLGPARVTQEGLLTPAAVRAGMLVVFGLAFAAGLYLVSVAGWIIAAVGTAAIVSAIAYTGGPYPLGYHGLGDLFVFLFFGFVAVCGTAFVQVGSVPLLAWIAALPVGSLATAILVVNNVRDADTDRRAGKKTIAARFGRKVARREFAFLLGTAYVVPAAAAAGASAPWILLPTITLPLALRQGRAVFRETGGPALNRSLAGTARLLFLHGFLLSIGIVLSRPS